MVELTALRKLLMLTIFMAHQCAVKRMLIITVMQTTVNVQVTHVLTGNPVRKIIKKLFEKMISDSAVSFDVFLMCI